MNRSTVFITGAGAGIGLEAARLFHSHGWYVGIFDVNPASADAAATALGGDSCYAGPVDVRQPDSIQSALNAFAEQTGGRLDVLINNAGVLRVSPFEEVALDVHHAQIEVNIKGLVSCTHLAFPLLRDTPGARVINMASASAQFGVPDFATYSATKFFVRGLTEALNIEWRRHDIRVCDIWPPFVKTAMVEGVESDVIERMGVNLMPDQVAEVIWKAAHGRKVHWPVGLQFKVLRSMLQHAPYSVNRAIMRFLTGY